MKYLFLLLVAAIAPFISSQVEIFNENFSQGIPSTWTMFDVDGNIPNSAVSEYNKAWITVVNPENSADSIASATSFFTSPSSANKWLITAPIVLGDNNNVLKWKSRSFDGSYPENYIVYISTTNNDIANFTDTLALFLQESNEWTEHEINLSELNFNDQTVYIAFVLKTYDGFKLLLDDVSVSKAYPLGISEKNVADFSIINYSSDKIKVKSQEKIDQLFIFDSFGKAVFKGENNEINISNLTSGIYFLKVKTISGNVATRKFLKN